MVNDPEGALEKILSDPKQEKTHRDRYKVLVAEEYEKLVSFLGDSKADCFLKPEVTVSPERIRIMAKMCQTDNLDSNDACEMLAELVGYVWECEADYSEEGFTVTFSDEAIDRILSQVPRNRKSVKAICDKVIESCEYGLRLLGQRKDIHEIVIPGEGIDDPEKFINELVENKFKL